MDDASISGLLEVAESHGFMDAIAADLDQVTRIKPVPVPITAAPLVAVPQELLEKVGNLLLEESLSKARALGLERVETALLGEDAAHEVLRFARHARPRRHQKLLPGQRFPEAFGRGRLPVPGGQVIPRRPRNDGGLAPARTLARFTLR